MRILTRLLKTYFNLFSILFLVTFQKAHAELRSPQYRSQSIEVIDIHQHVGNSETMGPLGKQFVLNNLPRWLPLGVKNWTLETYAKLVLQAYTPVFGVRANCIQAALSKCGLLAVYAPLTWGTTSNDDIIGILDDARNRGPSEEPGYFFGTASLNIQRFPEAALDELAQLRKALHHPLMKGIKLAFVHNELPLDDQQFDGIYQIAREFSVPVYHHIGTSPLRRMKDFKSEDEKNNYLRSADPTGLEWAIAKYPDVPFILGHMGFDFNKEGVDFSESVYQLAAKYPNVYLEISAFGLAMYDKDGKYMDGVLKRLKSSNLLSRVLYGSDASGQPGATTNYRDLTLKSMDRVGYSLDDVRAVMSLNSRRIYRL